MLEQLERLADTHHCEVGVLVVEGGAHPRARMLTSLDHRLQLLAETGKVHTAWVVPSTIHSDPYRDLGRALDTVRPLSLVLLRFIQLGSPEPLSSDDFASLCAERDIELVSMGGGAADRDDSADALFSVKNISDLLAGGHVAEAGWLLGHLFEMRGVVEQGDQRGRTLGVPTANLAVESSFLLPTEGVYVGVTIIADGSVHPTAISLGRRPTFYEDGWELLEAHLLDFDGDLYGQSVRVLFTEQLRGQRKFTSIHELKGQLHIDIAATRALDPVRRYESSLAWSTERPPF